MQGEPPGGPLHGVGADEGQGGYPAHQGQMHNFSLIIKIHKIIIKKHLALDDVPLAEILCPTLCKMYFNYF